MRAAHSTVGDDIWDEDNIVIEREETEVNFAKSIQESLSDQGEQMSDAQPTWEGSDVAWEEIEYKIYSKFQDSDGYAFSEYIAAMKDKPDELSDKHKDTSKYKTTVEELSSELGPRIKYMSTSDFSNVKKREQQWMETQKLTHISGTLNWGS